MDRAAADWKIVSRLEPQSGEDRIMLETGEDS
jgi:hypothetical protein